MDLLWVGSTSREKKNNSLHSRLGPVHTLRWVSGYMPSPASLSLTCALVFHTDQHKEEDRQAEDDEDHYGNSHHHTNDDSSVHARAWRRRWRRECACRETDLTLDR